MVTTFVDQTAIPETGAPPVAGAKLYGVLAEYATSEATVKAVHKVVAAGFKHWDAYSPYKDEKIYEAMKVKRSNLPWVIVCWGLVGTGLAMFFQYWFNGLDYPQVFAGKPPWSLPANIPVMFELTVLFASFGAIIGFFMFTRLPKPYHPLFTNRRFARASQDRFFIVIEAKDLQFDLERTAEFLENTGADAVEPVRG